MKNIAIKLVTLCLLSMFAFGKAFAVDIRYGVSGAIATLDGSGNEVEGGETSVTENVHNNFALGSIFVELDQGTFALGIDYIPFDADVSNATHERSENETSVTGTTTETTTARVNTAAAEISDHLTIYTRMMMGDTWYAHLGYVQMDIVTQENLGTGSTYPDETVNGYQLGLGLKASDRMRYEVLYTDYDDISITSSTTRTGVSPNNKIEADLDVLQLKASFAF